MVAMDRMRVDPVQIMEEECSKIIILNNNSSSSSNSIRITKVETAIPLVITGKGTTMAIVVVGKEDLAMVITTVPIIKGVDLVLARKDHPLHFKCLIIWMRMMNSLMKLICEEL